MNKPTLAELVAYTRLLNNFDWYYEYSDDHSVWQRGNQISKELRQYAQQHPIYQRAYDAVYNCVTGTDTYENRIQLKEKLLDELKEEVAGVME